MVVESSNINEKFSFKWPKINKWAKAQNKKLINGLKPKIKDLANIENRGLGPKENITLNELYRKIAIQIDDHILIRKDITIFYNKNSSIILFVTDSSIILLLIDHLYYSIVLLFYYW